jgi:hypothetical protein
MGKIVEEQLEFLVHLESRAAGRDPLSGFFTCSAALTPANQVFPPLCPVLEGLIGEVMLLNVLDESASIIAIWILTALFGNGDDL